jgi:endogenous inhibitor of DNA gyrase (YacG/DUF329 family)
MAAKATYKCRTCGKPFEARVADRKRGWARFCSKSCKAIKQEQRTGQHRAHQGYIAHREREDLNGPTFVGCALSIEDHDPNKGDF